MMTWYVYIIECGDGSLYTGITTDLNRRLEEHEEGRGAKYMRGRGPFSIVYSNETDSRSSASKLEFMIKKMNKADKRSLIAGNLKI